MPLKSPEEYLRTHASSGGNLGIPGDGVSCTFASGQADCLLKLEQLGACLETALRDFGIESAELRRTIARSLEEEYALRAGNQPLGVGALSRLLGAAASRASAMTGTTATGAETVAPKRKDDCGSNGGIKRPAEDTTNGFDAIAKERALQAEAASWAAPSRSDLLPIASEEDIPTLDVSCLANDRLAPEAMHKLADQLRRACQDVGFHFITGHGLSESLLTRIVEAIESFSELPHDTKQKYLMDTGAYPDGTGFLPVHNRKLPKRKKGNVVQAFVLKRELGPRNITLNDMPWPTELGDKFRHTVQDYAAAVEDLAMRMLPAYSLALGEEPDYFASAFKSPMWRLRLSKYPAVEGYEDEQYGIAPHVDTSFFTVLHRVEQQPGLVVWSAKARRWVRVPSKSGALLVNTGEILRQVSNDTFLSARHYVLNDSSSERSSLAFFFNATADHKLSVATGAGGGPPKYPPTSYLDGQGVVQGE